MASARVIWGPTPTNDNLASRRVSHGHLRARSPGRTASRQWRVARVPPASVTPSLWWTYEAPASGWYRFWIDESFSAWVLAVYGESPGGFGPIEFVRSSHQPEGIGTEAIEIVFYAAAGARYKIRLGARGGGTDGAVHDPLGRKASSGLAQVRRSPGRRATGTPAGPRWSFEVWPGWRSTTGARRSTRFLNSDFKCSNATRRPEI